MDIAPGAAPLRAAEHAFTDLAGRLHLEPVGDASGTGGLFPPVPMDLFQVRTWLLQPGLGHRDRDGAWRRIITRARAEQDWMVAAIGLAMPALRAAARRSTRGLDAAAAADVEAEILAGFVTAVGEVNLEWTRLVWRLRCRAQRAGIRARHREERHPGLPEQVAESAVPRPPWGHPDLVLADAVAAGVLTAAEAQLIAETRLAGATLHQIAADLGVGYKTVHKRRHRAEARLVAALSAGEVGAGVTAPTTGR
ncbi:sigma-70 family RNA polymerase sigma factor [Streptomonospora sp. PA3]|uniref:sigma-70 family RNA polymerase sigma factor n=1 Tax=Streptomonospora sp. PA3 TaxID=2607326 RepID=UPI0012DF41CD|nr:sigma-70 family RNA polymerase sigma factor [Streptomonospora sp. PA3]MUL41556.1 sigma-70 family RNA polymerase sigma factor [Streptomonospora sp. PA3]